MEGFVRWPAGFADRYRKEGYWLDRTISEVMDESFKRYNSRTALISDDGTTLGYQEMEKLVTRLSLHFNAMGLKLYDRVIMQIPNSPAVAITYLGILKAGGIPIMALPAFREAEISYFAALAEARCLCIPTSLKDFDFQQMAAGVQHKVPGVEMVFVVNGEPLPGYHSIDMLLQDPIEERIDAAVLPRPDPGAPAVLQLSGGTTGIPKLIPRTHNDYVYNFLRHIEICRIDKHTVLLAPIPQLHNFAVACPGLMGIIAKGACEILSARPVLEHLLELMQRYKVTHWVAVPPLIIALLNHPQRHKFDLSSVKVVWVGGAKLNPEVAVRISSELNWQYQHAFGMAEGMCFWTRLDDPEEVRVFTQGRPISQADEFKIVDPITGLEVPLGEVGELWCRGPYTIRGYYRAPEQNAKGFDKDGFYKTGDLVRLHPSGNVVVEGRLKDAINRGGEKISAEEVENHILAHPDVGNCACVAMPDPVLGERLCAFVVLRPDKALNLTSLCEFLLKERKIAKFKLPERLELLDALPVTHVGKSNKKEMRRIIAEKLKAEQRFDRPGAARSGLSAATE